MDLFRTLTQGVKFDKDRFLNDAMKLNVVKLGDELRIAPDNVDSGAVKYNVIKKKVTKDTGHPSEEQQDEVTQYADGSSFRKVKGVHIWGSDIPKATTDFRTIKGITERMLQNLAKLGYEDPTPIQSYAIPIIRKGRELLASAPTGSGKTAAYLIPLLTILKKPNKEGVRSLILSPTRVLAHQIYAECLGLSQKTKLKTTMIRKKAMKEDSIKKSWNSDIVVTTPNRLVNILKEGWVDLSKVQHLIIDECDNLFEEGFQDQIGFIYSACTNAKVKRYMFSATCSYNVEVFCKTHLDNHITLSLGPKSATVDLVDQTMTFVGTEFGKLLALMDLIRNGIEPPVLIFVQNEDRAKELYTELTHNEIACGVIYGSKTQAQQEKIVESFRMGKTNILISTAILSRGIDFPALKMVINYDLPASPVQYIHNVGRTGRAGRIGRCVSFFTEKDHENLQRIAHVLQNTGFEVPEFLLKLKKARRDEVRVPNRERISRRTLPKKRKYYKGNNNGTKDQQKKSKVEKVTSSK